MAKRLTRFGPGLLALLLLWTPAHAADETTRIEPLTIHALVLPEGRSIWRGRIEVPEGARALTVAACSPRDVDLFLRRGEPLGEDPVATADASGRAQGPMEVVQLTLDGAVPVQPGTWFLAATRPPGSDNGARFELVALVDTEGGPRAVVPRAGETQIVMTHQAGAELRTFLPSHARELRLTLNRAVAPGVQFRLRGPRSYQRGGVASRRIVLQRGESPPGIYTLDLFAEDAGALPKTIEVQAAWGFGAATSPVATPALPLVRPGSSAVIRLGGTQPTARTVRIPVRRGTGGLRIDATNTAKADVDLYVRHGRPLERGDADADYFALSSAPSERLVVGGSRGLPGGIYYCELVLVHGKGPVAVTLRVTPFRSGRGRGTWGERAPPGLAPGPWTPGRVQAGLAGLTWYTLAVPAGARSLHAVLFGATAPLDLVLARESDGSIVRRALSARVDERIDHSFQSPIPRPQRLLLGVMNRNPYEEQVDFRVALSFNTPPSAPKDVTWPPVIDYQRGTPTLRGAAASVELTVRGNAGGSGTCVSPRGRILTCRHVLEIEGRGGAIQRDGILVAFPTRLASPPLQSYVARVTHEDRGSDLALLEITSDVFGRRLPPDASLPWVELGEAGGLGLGDPVSVFGYPSEGSERTRTPVVLTRGIVSGLEAVGGRLRWIKTDAWIGLGHSGGSLMDRTMRLAGVAAATLGDSEVLGLVIPIGLVPADWRDLIRGDRR